MRLVSQFRASLCFGSPTCAGPPNRNRRRPGFHGFTGVWRSSIVRLYVPDRSPAHPRFLLLPRSTSASYSREPLGDPIRLVVVGLAGQRRLFGRFPTRRIQIKRVQAVQKPVAACCHLPGSTENFGEIGRLPVRSIRYLWTGDDNESDKTWYWLERERTAVAFAYRRGASGDGEGRRAGMFTSLVSYQFRRSAPSVFGEPLRCALSALLSKST